MCPNVDVLSKSGKQIQESGTFGLPIVADSEMMCSAVDVNTVMTLGHAAG